MDDGLTAHGRQMDSGRTADRRRTADGWRTDSGRTADSTQTADSGRTDGERQTNDGQTADRRRTVGGRTADSGWTADGQGAADVIVPAEFSVRQRFQLANIAHTYNIYMYTYPKRAH